MSKSKKQRKAEKKAAAKASRKAARKAERAERQAAKAERQAVKAEQKHRVRTIALAYKHRNPAASNDEVASYVQGQMHVRYGNVLTILLIIKILAKLFAMFSDLDDEAMTPPTRSNPYPPYGN